MSRINHARHIHRGRQTEFALPYKSLTRQNIGKAKPANAGRSLSAEEKAAIAAQLGLTLSARAA